MPPVLSMRNPARLIDWAALVLLAYEVPCCLLSQYRANSIGDTEAVGLSILAYFAARLLARTPLRAAGLASFIGICGAWFSITGIRQFASGSQHLAAAGLI